MRASFAVFTKNVNKNNRWYASYSTHLEPEKVTLLAGKYGDVEPTMAPLINDTDYDYDYGNTTGYAL